MAAIAMLRARLRVLVDKLWTPIVSEPVISEPLDVIVGWCAGRTGLDFKPPYSALASVDAGGRITAALVFQNWTGQDIEISVAASSIPRALLAAGYRYAVGQLGCRRATFRMRADNDRAQRAMERLGAKREGRLRRFYGDGCDAVVFGILKEDYPYGQRSVSAAAA